MSVNRLKKEKVKKEELDRYKECERKVRNILKNNVLTSVTESSTEIELTIIGAIKFYNRIPTFLKSYDTLTYSPTNLGLRYPVGTRVADVDFELLSRKVLFYHILHVVENLVIRISRDKGIDIRQKYITPLSYRILNTTYNLSYLKIINTCGMRLWESVLDKSIAKETMHLMGYKANSVHYNLIALNWENYTKIKEKGQEGLVTFWLMQQKPYRDDNRLDIDFIEETRYILKQQLSTKNIEFLSQHSPNWVKLICQFANITKFSLEETLDLVKLNPRYTHFKKITYPKEIVSYKLISLLLTIGNRYKGKVIAYVNDVNTLINQIYIVKRHTIYSAHEVVGAIEEISKWMNKYEVNEEEQLEILGFIQESAEDNISWEDNIF